MHKDIEWTSYPLQKWLQWFRYEPEQMRQRDTRVYLGLLDDVRERIETGTAMPSIASKALEKTANWGLSDIEIAYALSAPWQAGVTTVGAPSRLANH